jgi:phosphoglycerol transferase MdoB-like AlkP superfamily enzyme
MTGARWGRSSWILGLVPIVSSTALYFIFTWIGQHFFSVRSITSIPEIFALTLIGYLLFALANRVSLFLITQTIFVGTLYIANSLKFAYFGGPMLPSDVYSMGALIQVAQGIDLAGLLLPPAAFLGILLVNLKFTIPRLSSVLIALLAVYGVVRSAPDKVVGLVDSIWKYNGSFQDEYNYRRMGAVVFLAQDYVRQSMNRSPIPSRNAVAEALRVLGRHSNQEISSASDFERRNVYIYMLEAFWDSSLLTNAGFSRDPWEERFRQLWVEGGRSTALSPVFGGHTANAEFEILCGQEVHYARDVVFMHALVRNARCLPRMLGESGYTTFSSHPNRASFWNRVSAYERLGFGVRYFKPDFEFDDLNGRYLSDESLFRQTLERVDSHSKQNPGPVFVYLMSISGHQPYDVNAEVRPKVIDATTEVDAVIDYSNSMYYTSKELFESVEQLRIKDPSAIVIVTGDHPPVLGLANAGYKESNLLTSASDAKENKLLTMSRVPIIVIDGERGPIDVGRITMYEVPALTLTLLGYPLASEIMNLFSRSDGIRVRPNGWGSLLVHDGEGRSQVCLPDASDAFCQDALAWRHSANVVTNDQMRGRAYATGMWAAGRASPRAPDRSHHRAASAEFTTEWLPSESDELAP